jgi:putative sigma-54 modulation protein
MSQEKKMHISVRGKNLEVTEALRHHAEKKVQKIGKFFRDGGADAEVVLSVQRELHTAEVTVQVKGLILRGESRTSDMYASIDAAVDRIERQFEKYKTKILRRLQDAPKLSAERQAEPEEVSEEKEPVVVRSKHFDVKPMDVEEAITQMELLGHDFFVFHNAATRQINVVYKRRDGNYGLIETE